MALSHSGTVSMKWEDGHETFSNPMSGTQGESNKCLPIVTFFAKFPKPNILNLEGSEQPRS